MKKLIFHQKEIKKCGKCVKYVSYLLYFAGVVGIVTNLWFILFGSNYTRFPIPGFNDNIHWLELDIDTLDLMALAKVVCCIAFIRQAKGALEIF